MKKGIVCGSLRACFPEPVEPKQLFALAKDAGLDGVELNCNPNGDFDIDDPDEKLKRLRRAADDVGVELPSVMPPWFDMVNPDATVRDHWIGYPQRLIERVEMLGVKAILTITGRVSPEVPYDVAYERTMDALKRVAPTAEEHGVDLCLENVWNNFLYSPLEFAGVIDAVGSARVKAYFDVGNFVFFAYPAQWIRLLGPRLGKVHVKDFDRNVGGPTAFRRLLEGSVDWADVRQALIDVGYDDFLTAEVPTYKTNPRASIYETARQIGMIIEGDV